MIKINSHTLKAHKIGIIVLFNFSLVFSAFAQNEKEFIRKRINVLTSPELHGRGYVQQGGEKAANYIANEFKSYGVQTIRQYGSYFQEYNFPINTFPTRMFLQVNKTVLKPGPDYIVNAASTGWKTKRRMKMKTIDLVNVKDSIGWYNVKKGFHPERAYYLKNADTPGKYLELGIRKFATELPKALYVVPKHGKLIWTANSNLVPGTIITVEDTALPVSPRKVTADIRNVFVNDYRAKNVAGYVKGTKYPDSFIVFTAHYDHLGRMGKNTLFPGANDNSSGTSLVLYLASYFAKHPQPYSVAFILFSGEEVGLLGSDYYVKNPIFPLNQIRFLVNLDMTGDATNGITVVNGVSHEPEFAILESINTDSVYAKKINKRERTNNSDHYHFSKAGVPAVFIFTNGTKPHYHDVFDVADEINLERVDGLAQLLIKFTGKLSGAKE